MKWMLSVALWLFICVTVFAQQPAGKKQQKEVDIEELLRQLASEDWRTRKRAYKALEVFADRYVSRLKKAGIPERSCVAREEAKVTASTGSTS